MKICSYCGQEIDDNDVFCGYCGKKYVEVKPEPQPSYNIEDRVEEENTKTCPNCGSKISSNDTVCPNCGYQIEQPSFDFEQTMSNATEKAKQVGKTVSNSVQSLGKSISNQFENVTKKQQEEIDREVERQKKAREQQREIHFSNVQKFMAKADLWSWLKKNQNRQLFYTEQPNTLTEEEFMNIVNDKLIENGVPAKIEGKRVRWDRSSVYDNVYSINPSTEAINPLTCLVGFKHVGNFTFVEKKTFITPPNLPEVPMNRITSRGYKDTYAKLFLYGGVLIILGLMTFSNYYFAKYAMVLMLLGFALCIGGGYFYSKQAAIDEHNKKCYKMEVAWNSAWANWERSVLNHSFQEDINGELSRLYDSCYETVKQVSKIELGDQSTDTAEENTQADITAQVARQKKAYR